MFSPGTPVCFPSHRYLNTNNSSPNSVIAELALRTTWFLRFPVCGIDLEDSNPNCLHDTQRETERGRERERERKREREKERERETETERERHAARLSFFRYPLIFDVFQRLKTLQFLNFLFFLLFYYAHYGAIRQILIHMFDNDQIFNSSTTI